MSLDAITAIAPVVAQVGSAAGSFAGAGLAAGQAGTNIDILRAQEAIRLREHERQTRALVARQRARFAAAGVLVDTGTPLDVLADTLSQAAEQEAQIRLGTELDIEQQKARRRAALAGGITQGLTTLLGAATSIPQFRSGSQFAVAPVASTPTQAGGTLEAIRAGGGIG